MASTDIDGTPIIVMSLPQVKTLMEMLDKPETPAQDMVMKRIVRFVNDPQCLKWERERAERE